MLVDIAQFSCEGNDRLTSIQENEVSSQHWLRITPRSWLVQAIVKRAARSRDTLKASEGSLAGGEKDRTSKDNAVEDEERPRARQPTLPCSTLEPIRKTKTVIDRAPQYHLSCRLVQYHQVQSEM